MEEDIRTAENQETVENKARVVYSEKGGSGRSSDQQSLAEPVGDAEAAGIPDPARIAEAEAFAAEVEKRIRAREKKRVGRKRRTVVILILILGLMMTMCGREIVRLKAENMALKKQQKELEEERDRLSEELKNSKDRDYVEEKAREQLRLLNEGEILFLFDDEEGGSGNDSKDGAETESKEE